MFESLFGKPPQEKPKAPVRDTRVEDVFAQTGKARLDHLNRPAEQVPPAPRSERSFISPVEKTPFEAAGLAQDNAPEPKAPPVRMAQPERFLETVTIDEATDREFRNAAKEEDKRAQA